MKPRHNAILDMLKEEHKVNVKELASRLSVSEMTIRRDMARLENEGYLVRTHGGGITTERINALPRAISDVDVSLEKSAIGKAAAALVEPDQTILLDAGTTALQVALNIPQDTRITVATVSLCVAQALYGSNIDVLVMGGNLRKEFPSLYGPMTERSLAEFHVDVFFAGCDGADTNDGFYIGDLYLSNLEKAMIRIADKVVIVAESRKFGKRAFVRYAKPEDISFVVTDPGIADSDRKALEDQGVKVIIAGDTNDG